MLERQRTNRSTMALACLGFCWALSPNWARAVTCKPMGDPKDLPMASSGESQWWGTAYSFYQCVNNTDTLRCWFNLTKTKEGTANIGFPKEWTDNIKLKDNFQEHHSFIRAAFQTGKCRDLRTTDMSQGDSIWFYIDFNDPGIDIKSVTISLPAYILDGHVRATMEFKGPAVISEFAAPK